MKGDKGMADWWGELERLLGNAQTAGCVSEEIIAGTEVEYGVRFPRSYRLFLSTYGAALGEGFEIAGLIVLTDIDSPPMWRCVRSAIVQARRACPDIPTTHIPISSDGMDNAYYLDLSEADQGNECPVVVLGPGYDNVRIAGSFAEFAVRLAKNKLLC